MSFSSRVRIGAIQLAALASLSMYAEVGWDRRAFTEKGGWTDSSAPHKLSYFTQSACIGHAPAERVSPASRRAWENVCSSDFRHQLKLIGHIGVIAVYDLYYIAQSSFGPEEASFAKSILVQVGPSLFREIYHRPKNQMDAGLPATRIVTAGTKKILVARYDVGGMYHSFEEDFFAIELYGVKLLNPEPIFEAGKRGTPKDQWIYQPASGFSFDKLIWTAGTEPTKMTAGPKASCCTGRVTVQFTVENAALVPGAVSYQPTFFK